MKQNRRRHEEGSKNRRIAPAEDVECLQSKFSRARKKKTTRFRVLIQSVGPLGLSNPSCLPSFLIVPCWHAMLFLIRFVLSTFSPFLSVSSSAKHLYSWFAEIFPPNWTSTAIFPVTLIASTNLPLHPVNEEFSSSEVPRDRKTKFRVLSIPNLWTKGKYRVNVVRGEKGIYRGKGETREDDAIQNRSVGFPEKEQNHSDVQNRPDPEMWARTMNRKNRKKGGKNGRR